MGGYEKAGVGIPCIEGEDMLDDLNKDNNAEKEEGPDSLGHK